MYIPILVQLEYLLRILVAAFCGAVIGYERENHLKTAGMRTHCIVSVTSALMMVVSKYGFGDVIGLTGIRLDPSRIAAGAVTAVGFLGAGVIFIRKQNISGLTTAAGIWATVGVGSAIGAGIYLIGAVATAIIILIHVVLHRKSPLKKETMSQQITLLIGKNENAEDLLSVLFSSHNIEITSIRARKLNHENLEIRLSVKYPESYEIMDIIRLLKDEESIRSIEI